MTLDPGIPELPGTVKPGRFVPRFHWELLVCGLRGHALVGTDAAELRPRDALVAREIDGVRWHRCVRCDSWLPIGPPEHPAVTHPPDRDEIILPLRGRPLRDKIVLRLIAINRAVHFLVLGLLSVAIFLFASNRSALRDPFYRVLTDIQGGVGGGPVQASRVGILHDFDRLFSLQDGTLHLVAAAVAVYAALEGVEAVGLWLQQRWAEYLTLLVTASFLPLEVYELVTKASPLKGIAIVVNTAVVVYLLYGKRLFGLRGGVAAEHRARERDVGWPALERSSPERAGVVAVGGSAV